MLAKLWIARVVPGQKMLAKDSLTHAGDIDEAIRYLRSEGINLSRVGFVGDRISITIYPSFKHKAQADKDHFGTGK